MAITIQDVLDTITQDMSKANETLLETTPDRFNRSVLNHIQEEIRKGKEKALSDRHKDPDSRLYVHYAHFPLSLYQGMTSDFLKELEAREIVIYTKEHLNYAMIKIVFRF